MKLKINKLLLDSIIERVAKAIDPNPFIPELKGILIVAEGNKITLIGSNGTISVKHEIITSLDAEIITPGRILVDLYLFRNIIKKLENDIVLESQENKLNVETENDHFSLNLYNIFEYPDIDFSIYGEQIKIKWQKFKSMVRNVAVASSSLETNIILCCINISAQNQKLKFVATDKYRYAEEVLDIEENVNFNISVLTKNLKDLLNFDYSGDVILNFSDQKISFEIDGSIIQSKVVDQVYLDVSKIIPKSFDNVLVISKKELNDLLNKASVIISENYNKIRLHILDQVLTISSTREEIANAEIKSKNFSYTENELKLALNSRFLKDAIQSFDDEIKLSLTPDKMRIVITSNSNPNLFHLITPQRGF
ncbi:DNA polymerase III subunit beta [Metamycoplasma alkalescens]|uniref:DNA polymerase III beta chain n=4 Tax=Metamycoplasma alkalescens TaxID=45363 RepID=N9UB93_9BACT|nr:DNA polymerase III subunit beta [Metamycoplasma alkalescens]ENY53986.1 DNA polymerase III beta chain [Metamycoplasma alkalescens 14918]PYF42653.1 DNA polymerase-3 subunit beta [Metamycoplasma alkalescens]